MNNNNEELIKQIENFEEAFSKYFKTFSEYLDGGFLPDSPYKLGHPTLFENAINLQTAFYMLPEQIRNRLLLLDFEVFLHCNNSIDFYNLRIFLLKKQRFNKTTTIAVRVDAEINLSKSFINNGIFNEYNNLPKPNFQFYRDYDVKVSLLEELLLEQRDQEQKKRSDTQNDDVEKDSDVAIAKEQEESIYDDITKKIKKGEELVNVSDSFLGKSIGLIEKIIKFGNLFG